MIMALAPMGISRYLLLAPILTKEGIKEALLHALCFMQECISYAVQKVAIVDSQVSY